MHRSYALIVSSHCAEITKISSQRIDKRPHCVESKKIAPQRTDKPKKPSINRKKHHKQKTPTIPPVFSKENYKKRTTKIPTAKQ